MALLVHPGYMGYAEIEDITTPLRFTDGSVTVRQDVNIPDIITGHWDHLAFNYNPIEVGGTLSGPVTDTFAQSGGNSVWDWATARTDCGEVAERDISFHYYCDTSGNTNRLFERMRVNQVSFSCAAGDIAQFSLDIIGTSAASFSTGGGTHEVEEKLITWDQCQVTITGGTSAGDLTSNDWGFQNFEFTLANNITPVYAIKEAGTQTLFPYEVVPGQRTITGSLSVYDIPGVNGFDKWADYNAYEQSTMEFKIGATTVSFKVYFHRIEPASSVGPIVSSIGFTGVGVQTF